MSFSTTVEADAEKVVQAVKTRVQAAESELETVAKKELAGIELRSAKIFAGVVKLLGIAASVRITTGGSFSGNIGSLTITVSITEKPKVAPPTGTPAPNG